MSPRVYDHLLPDPAVQRWFRYKQPLTRDYYGRVMNRFLQFTGSELGLKTPTEFVTWAKSRPDILDVQDTIEKFGERESETGRLNSMSVIRSLLKKHGSILPSMSGQRQVQKAFHRGYSREEIQTLLGYLDEPLAKLYVMFGKDSGLRAQDLLSISYGHVKKDLEAGKEYVHLALEPSFYNRRKASGITFIGPNTVKLLKQLLDQDMLRRTPDEKFFPMTYSSMAGTIRIARNKAKLDPLIQPNHGLRKFFENCLDRVGMDVHKKLQLEGHSQGVRVHYTDRDVEDLRNLYAKAYQFLDLSEEAAAETRVRELERVVGEQQKTIEVLKGQASSKEDLLKGVLQEVASLRRKMEEYTGQKSES